MTSLSRPTFTVVVPTHRRPDLVLEAVASVLAQTREDWECLVVDDGGGDPLDRLPADDRIRVIRRPEAGGPAAARNTGVGQARGSVITFLDDDDRFVPERLELADHVLADPRVDVAVCWTAWFEPTAADSSNGSSPSGRRLDGDVAATILDATTPHLGATAVRAEAMVPFDESYRSVEDVEWWLRLAAVTLVATAPVVGCELRRHPGARANGTDRTGRVTDGLRLLGDHAEYFAGHPRAEAFRLARTANLALADGDRRQARALLVRSLRRRPSPLAAQGLLRSWTP